MEAKNKGKEKSIYRRGQHPNTKAAFAKHQIQKGEVKNPIGAAAHDPVKKLMRRFTNEYMKEIVELAVMGNLEGLKEVAENPNTPAIQVGVATALMGAIKSGDWTTLRSIVAEILGKQPDKVISDVNVKHSIVETEEQKEERKKRVSEKLQRLKLLNASA